MRRVALEALVLGLLLVGLALGLAGSSVWEGVAAPGALGARLVWQVSQLPALLAGWIGLGAPGPLETPPALGLPVVATAWLFSHLLLTPVAASIAAFTWLAAGPAMLWGIARARGASATGAAGAAVVGGLAPVMVGGLVDGRSESLAVPVVVLALVGADSNRSLLRGASLLAIVVAGTFHQGLGVALGLAVAVAGGGGLALLAGMGSIALGSADALTRRSSELIDLAAPLVSLRPEAEPVGVGALLAVLWFLPPSPARRAAMLAFVYALGPIAPVVGELGVALPMPGLLQALLCPADLDWSGGLIVGSAAGGLALARPGFASSVALFPAFTLAELLWLLRAGLPNSLVEPPLIIADLGSRRGGVLHLPLEVRLPTMPRFSAAPAGSHALYLSWQPQHQRPLPLKLAPLGGESVLYAEPGVVMMVDLLAGGGAFLIPPLRPGDALRGLDIPDLVVHRGRLPDGAKAALDPIFERWYGPPQRDLAGDVDLYRVPESGTRYPSAVTPLRPTGDSDAHGWLSAADYLREQSPPAASSGARRGAKPPPGGSQRPPLLSPPKPPPGAPAPPEDP